MLAKTPKSFPFSLIEGWYGTIPLFLCPTLKQSPALSSCHSTFSARRLRVSPCKRNTSTDICTLESIHQSHNLGRFESRAVSGAVKVPPRLPRPCPGCGALAQGLGSQDEAGYYNPKRNSVKAYIARSSHTCLLALREVPPNFEQAATEESDAILHSSALEEILSTTTLRQPEIHDDEGVAYVEVPMPVCNRCHCLLHHNKGKSIIHLSLPSIQKIISESPYSYNHIYHILDAADFPLSLIPQLQRRLDLMPQRSQNRRAKTRAYSHGRCAEMSFIITRSDLLAPQKEQVDSLMPYLQQVLRDALGSSTKDVRLGNVRCVSAKRGWWTKQVKNEIWERGGGGWLLGKVNVGKSNLLESVFPKGSPDRILAEIEGTSKKQPHYTGMNSQSLATGIAMDRLPFPIPSVPVEDSFLPPVQPETDFPIMPTVSHLPGTTASPIRIPFGHGKGELIDLPGVARGSLEDHVVESHRSDLVMRQRVKPEQFVIKPGQSLLISGLIRITPTKPKVTVLAYPFVPLSAHVTSTDKAIAIHTQAQRSGVPSIAKQEVGQKMGLAGSFELQWDVTRQRAGPLTSSSAAALSTRVLPFVVLSTDILIEGCGWIELVAQVRKKDIEATSAARDYPAVDIWSPNGDYIAARRPMNGWLLGRPSVSVGRTRPRRSMKGVKRSLKLDTLGKSQ